MKISYSKPMHSSGFSLLELMLAMLIGLIILGGVMQMYLSSRDAQRTNDQHLVMLGNARFAIEEIAYDLRHTNLWGRHNNGKMVACQKLGAGNSTPCDAGNEMTAATDDCAVDEYINIERPLYAMDNSNLYNATCAKESYLTGTDVLTLRYADTNQIDDAVLAEGVAYVRATQQMGMLFIGDLFPDSQYQELIDVVDPEERKYSNHTLISRAYYVSGYTDDVNDGIPSLRRSDLVSGPKMKSDVLLSGVENFQLEFGVDLKQTNVRDRDGQVDSYVKASSVVNWSLDVVAVRIWLVMRTERTNRHVLDVAQSFNIAGDIVTYPKDGYRRYMISSVVKLRNTHQRDVKTAGG